MTTDNLIDGAASQAPLRAEASALPPLLSRAICGRWIRLLLSTLIGRVTDFRRRRAVEAELNRLDERTLHDIGVSKSDIPSIASQIYFRDETRRQRDVQIHAATFRNDGRAARGQAHPAEDS